jgi:hypothetical protein
LKSSADFGFEIELVVNVESALREEEALESQASLLGGPSDCLLRHRQTGETLEKLGRTLEQGKAGDAEIIHRLGEPPLGERCSPRFEPHEPEVTRLRFTDGAREQEPKGESRNPGT